MNCPITLNKTVAWFNKTEGRDKICKVMQYGSRFLMYHLAQKQKAEASAQFKALYQQCGHARKLFRLAKGLNELKSLIDLLGKKDINEIDKSITALKHILLFCYWFCDNMFVLCAIKFLKYDQKPYAKWGMTFWFWSMIVGLISAIREFLKLQMQKEKLRKSILVQSDSQIQNVKPDDLQKIKQKEKDIFIAIIKIFGDLCPAGQGSEIFPKVFKINLNDSQIGLGGLISGALSAWQAY